MDKSLNNSIAASVEFFLRKAFEVNLWTHRQSWHPWIPLPCTRSPSSISRVLRRHQGGADACKEIMKTSVGMGIGIDQGIGMEWMVPLCLMRLIHHIHRPTSGRKSAGYELRTWRTQLGWWPSISWTISQLFYQHFKQQHVLWNWSVAGIEFLYWTFTSLDFANFSRCIMIPTGSCHGSSTGAFAMHEKQLSAVLLNDSGSRLFPNTSGAQFSSVTSHLTSIQHFYPWPIFGPRGLEWWGKVRRGRHDGRDWRPGWPCQGQVWKYIWSC